MIDEPNSRPMTLRQRKQAEENVWDVGPGVLGLGKKAGFGCMLALVGAQLHIGLHRCRLGVMGWKVKGMRAAHHRGQDGERHDDQNRNEKTSPKPHPSFVLKREPLGHRNRPFPPNLTDIQSWVGSESARV
jgi:hypothetical protein